MAIRRINGLHLEQMLQNGLANLQNHEEEINRLNVFPVPDGDTGTNMRLTLQHGLRLSHSSETVGTFLKSLSDGMLLGARGNSGVILSQFFKGFYTELARAALIGPGEMRNALIRGYRHAYQSVVQPVEGTILSVAREGIEHIRPQINRNTTIDAILSMYIAEMRKTLALTPEMLYVLKEAGVVDSGAAGFILIFEGMLKCLYGETVTAVSKAEDVPQITQPVIDTDLFNEHSAFVDGYCMEFILQMLADDTYHHDFNREQFILQLQLLGNSIVAVRDESRVKVHIHTKKPAPIIELAQKYGEFLTFKLENMQVQHNEHDKLIESAPKKPLSIVAVVNGDGMASLFRDLGCDRVIDGGTTMNTSSEEFVAAFTELNAEHIVVLPNNKNVIRAAKQAASLTGGDNITVLPTESYAEGYFAIAMDIPDSDDVEMRLSQMKNGIENVTTLSETTASRDYAFHEISCKKGDEIVLIDGAISCVSDDWKSAILDAIRIVDSIDDRETCIVFRGKDVPPECEDELAAAVSELFPLLEMEFVDGGQEIYHWVIGVL